MTMRPGGAFGHGITSKGESVVEPESAGRERARKERIATMARKNEALSATPGARAAGTHKVEEPLSIGPRDALINDGHNDEDFVPDSDTKGYHTGMVRQPVDVMADEKGRTVGFVSDLPSKFEGVTIDDLKAKHNADESSKEWNEGTVAASPTLSAEDRKANGLKPAPGDGDKQ